MHRERPLDADAERDLADRERLAQAPVLAADHHALEHLNPLATPLDHPYVHLHGVAWAELRDIRAQVGLLDEIGLVHDSGSRVYQRVHPATERGSRTGTPSTGTAWTRHDVPLGVRRMPERGSVGAIIFAVIVAGVALTIELHSAVRRRRVARASVRVDLALRKHLEGAQEPIDLRTVLDSALADAGGGADIYASILDLVDLSRFRPEARRRHRDQALLAAVGQRLRDGGEPARDALLPARAVGSGHAAAHGRHPHGGRDRGGPLGGGGRPRRLGCHRADPDPGGRRVPRAGPGRVPGGSRSSPRPSHGRATEGPHVHEDALHRMDRRRPIRSLVVSADTAPVLPARGDGDRRGDRRRGARHVPRDRAVRTLRVGLEVGSGRVPASCSASASC